MCLFVFLIELIYKHVESGISVNHYRPTLKIGLCVNRLIILIVLNLQGNNDTKQNTLESKNIFIEIKSFFKTIVILFI